MPNLVKIRLGISEKNEYESWSAQCAIILCNLYKERIKQRKKDEVVWEILKRGV